MGSDRRNRGTEAYFENHYKPLDFDSLEEKILELKVLQKKAKSYGGWEDHPHGVVSQEILGAELGLIFRLQAERARAINCEQEKQSIESLQYSLDSMSPACKQYFAEIAVEARLKSQGLE